MSAPSANAGPATAAPLYRRLDQPRPERAIVLVWLNMFWLLGIVLIPFGTVLLYENDGKTPVLGGQIFCAILFLVSLALGLLIYVIANDTRVSTGDLAPQPFLWTQRYAIVWALAWVSCAVFGGVAVRSLWIAGFLMFPLSAYTPPAQRAWAARRAQEVGKDST